MFKKPKKNLDFSHDIESVRDLVNEALSTHNEEYVVALLHKLLVEYTELARLSTDDNYTKNWTHHNVLNYITFGEHR